MNKDYLEKASNALKQLRELCVNVAMENAGVHTLQVYKNAVNIEQDIKLFLEKTGQVRSDFNSLAESDKIPEPISISIIIHL